MASITPMRAMYLVTLAIVIVCGIVAVSIDSTVRNANNDTQRAYVAFNVLGVIFILLAFFLMILVVTACNDHYKAIMLSIIICTGLSMICYAVSAGVQTSIMNFPPMAWSLSALWSSVIAVVIALVFLFSDPESI
ncbi:unnamed protein product [Calicophoron daubneyi]|uniref:Uncharacterized protein n=1 Tax=Calicophoron daubneyi TaxID=300641 RepID=A0AAV2T5N9_CALDB